MWIMKLDKDGKLAVPEKEVEKAVIDLLQANRFRVWKTDAAALTRAGASAFEEGTQDLIAVRPRQWPDCVGAATALFIELKRRRGRTNKKRLQKQTDYLNGLRRDHFAVYQAPENHPDPIGHFREWFKTWR